MLAALIPGSTVAVNESSRDRGSLPGEVPVAGAIEESGGSVILPGAAAAVVAEAGAL